MSLITLSGQGTSIQGNVTEGDIYSYGLNAYSCTSKILLIAPLTKEQISTNNGGGGNWSGDKSYHGSILSRSPSNSEREDDQINKRTLFITNSTQGKSGF